MLNFCKEERLSNNKLMSVLQNEGKGFFNFPFKIKWMEITSIGQNIVQILPAVSKRNFKKAVDRNYIKRQIREAYRVNKILLLEAIKKKSIVIMLIYTGNKIITYKETESKIVLILQHIADDL
jgi:ribonuclease P protein component